jgi:hypothetical protein
VSSPRSGLLPVAIVAALTAIGGVVRLFVLHDSLFADELSTYWIISGRDLGGVISTVHTNAEITPPLFFALSWLSTRIDLTAEMLRLPSFVAGVAAIPLVYLVGSRAVGRFAALLATALTALSPFMIYYSAEARGYGLMVGLTLLSTVAMLIAVEDRRTRWWVLYAASSCAAVYSHYTAVFVLGAQLLWLLWAHPESRRPALLANVGAVIGFAPWISGLIADLNSPTTKILGALEPFTSHTIATSLEHWSIAYPYGFVTLKAVPGTVGLALIAAGAAVAIVAVAVRRWGTPAFGELDRGVVLVVALALAAPVGEAAVSLVGNDLFGTRNLAVSWPGLALLVSTFVAGGRHPLRIAAAALLIGGFAIGAVRLTEPEHQRPDYAAAGRFIDENASPGAVVVDGAVLSPGPLDTLDLAVAGPRRVFRVDAPQERKHPFGLLDPILPTSQVMRDAVTAARGAPIFLVTLRTKEEVRTLATLAAPVGEGRAPYVRITNALTRRLPPGYRKVASQTYPGIATVQVQEYRMQSGSERAQGP